MVLQAHVVDLHIGKCTILQCLLDRKTRVIGMHVYLNHIVICHNYDRITDGFQICLKVHLLLDVKGLGKHDDKLCTITEFDIALFQNGFLAACKRSPCRSCGLCYRPVDLFA